MSKRYRIVVCDDHTLFIDGVKALLRGEPTLEVVAEARNGRQAVDKARQVQPDLVLMDVSMPDLTGFEATRQVLEVAPSCRVLILTMHDEEELVARCLEAGASGYIIKDAPASQLILAIQSVLKGEKYLSPGVLKKVVAGYVTGSRRPQTSYDRLSGREREVLKLLAEGLTVKEIATRLSLSIKTVDVHKYNLMRKIDVHDRSELIKYAIQNRLIEIPLARE